METNLYFKALLTLRVLQTPFIFLLCLIRLRSALQLVQEVVDLGKRIERAKKKKTNG